MTYDSVKKISKYLDIFNLLVYQAVDNTFNERKYAPNYSVH